VSLTLERGKTIGIVGESGSGKTVLSRSIMGLTSASNATITGSVMYDGQELVGRSPKQMRSLWGSEMAMVFQDPMTSLNPVKRIGVQITESMRYHFGLSRKDAYARALDLMNEVRIPEPHRRLDQYPHELSGGMRQRVTIAIALACEPRLLIADEPTTALDVTVQKQILDLLIRLQERHEMAMILITHDLGVVAGHADRVAVMYAGQFVEHADTLALFDNVKHPYTEALLESIPRVEQASHTRLEAIRGRPPDMTRKLAGCRFAPRCRFAQAACLEEEPALLATDDPGHLFRCFFPIGSAEGDRALRENLAAGQTAAGLVVDEVAVS
jgi:peptide/nickel transport system ATP-binding protein